MSPKSTLLRSWSSVNREICYCVKRPETKLKSCSFGTVNAAVNSKFLGSQSSRTFFSLTGGYSTIQILALKKLPDHWKNSLLTNLRILFVTVRSRISQIYVFIFYWRQISWKFTISTINVKGLFWSPFIPKDYLCPFINIHICC